MVCTRAFSLIEVLVVVVILGIVSALVIPQFAQATDQARTTAAESALATVRGSIASFRTHAILQGTAQYPTLQQLTSPGAVLAGEFPVNPFNSSNTVQAVSATQADSRAVINPETVGWSYFVDNESIPPRAIVYLNSATPTTRKGPGASSLLANQL